MNLTDTQMLGWIQHYAWIFARLAGVMVVAPVLGSRHVPRRIRVMLAVLMTLIFAPLVEAQPIVELFSAPWWLTTVVQFAIGVTIGFILLIAFEAVVMAGEIIAYGMGLSFAQLADPVRGVSTPVVAQFLLVITTLLFLSLNGHLILIDTLANSFKTMPLGTTGLSPDRIQGLVLATSRIFSGGLQMALAMTVALLLTNLAFGVASRATPALNLQSVGMPASIIAGFVLLALSVPSLSASIQQLLGESFEQLSAFIGGGGP